MIAYSSPSPNFSTFDKEAQDGWHFTVAFFGGSLTWVALSSDPQKTFYHVIIGQKLEETYPEVRFKFIDAAIGGTGSQLGIFRWTDLKELSAFGYNGQIVKHLNTCVPLAFGSQNGFPRTPEEEDWLATTRAERDAEITITLGPVMRLPAKDLGQGQGIFAPAFRRVGQRPDGIMELLTLITDAHFPSTLHEPCEKLLIS